MRVIGECLFDRVLFFLRLALVHVSCHDFVESSVDNLNRFDDNSGLRDRPVDDVVVVLASMQRRLNTMYDV